jgi:putative serine/threonine protein kinase
MAEVIPLEDERLKKIFSYPRYSEEHYQRVVEELMALGVKSIVSIGRLEMDDLRVVGKGCVGIVVAGILGQERVALKVLRADANRASLMEEARLMSVANVCKVGPKIITSNDSVIAMEYVDGKYLSRWLEDPLVTEKVRYVVRELLIQCYKLDEAGLDHGELSDAKKHILIDGRGRPYILDFETASMKRRCRNLVSMLSYLFFKESIAAIIGRYLYWDGGSLRGLIKVYKNTPSKIAYQEIMKGVGLD